MEQGMRKAEYSTLHIMKYNVRKSAYSFRAIKFMGSIQYKDFVLLV